MKLERGEISLLANFSNSNDAERALKEIKTKDLGEAQLDRTSLYGVTSDTELNNPIAGQADTNTGLTLYSADRDQWQDLDARILMNADPSAGGMSAKRNFIGGKSFLLTVVTKEQNVNQIKDIIEKHGGKV